METPVKKQQEEFFEELLESIKTKDEEIIERRIHHITFAKIITWLCIKSKKINSFEKNDIRRFVRLSGSRMHEVLEDFINAGIIKKKYNPSGRVLYILLTDTKGIPIVREYFERALKTLGKKPKKKFTLSVEQEMVDGGYF